MNRIIVGLLVGAAVVGGGAAATAEAAKPPCRTRSVYVVYGDPSPCDVSPPQRLHIVRTPNKAACDRMGGKWSTNRICWDVDY